MQVKHSHDETHYIVSLYQMCPTLVWPYRQVLLIGKDKYWYPYQVTMLHDGGCTIPYIDDMLSSVGLVVTPLLLSSSTNTEQLNWQT